MFTPAQPAPHAPPPLGPPLPVTALRALDLEQHPQPGRHAHLAAGSGMQVLGATAYVIADDELHLARFAATGTTPGTMLRVLPGPDLPLDPDARKAAKPDLEALTRLPGTDDGGAPLLVGVPSGSKPHRGTGFAWPLDASGALTGTPATVDFAPLYDALRGRIRGKLNIEGAALRGSELVLLHRGNSARGAAASIGLDLPTVQRQLRAGRLDGTAVTGVQAHDLGELDGVRLGFTDAVALPGGRIGFTAAAEVTDDPVDDGRVTGSVVGVLGARGQVEQLRRIGGTGMKVEGIAVVQSPAGQALLDGADQVHLRLVTDDDDASRASQLLGATLSLG
jgi:hypothetical protein